METLNFIPNHENEDGFLKAGYAERSPLFILITYRD